MVGRSNDPIEQIKEDIEFLLSFCPAQSLSQVEDNLPPMFYITGSYQGDKEIAARVERICERYQITLDFDHEDFADV